MIFMHNETLAIYELRVVCENYEYSTTLYDLAAHPIVDFCIYNPDPSKENKGSIMEFPFNFTFIGFV